MIANGRAPTGARNPIPAPGSRWLNKQHRHDKSEPTTIEVLNVYKDEHRGDVRIEYKNLGANRRAAVWYRTFRCASRFEPLPERPAEPVVPRVDTFSGEAARSLVKRIREALASLEVIVNGMP